MTMTIMYRARRARRAAEAIGCNTCLFLLQDLWAKVVGASAKSRPSQLLHRKQFGTEHDIVAAGTRTQPSSPLEKRSLGSGYDNNRAPELEP